MTRYERVTYRPQGGKRRTVLLEIKADGALLIGVEVGPDGDTRWFDRDTTERTHVISAELVEQRVPLRMDNHYGLLMEET